MSWLFLVAQFRKSLRPTPSPHHNQLSRHLEESSSLSGPASVSDGEIRREREELWREGVGADTFPQMQCKLHRMKQALTAKDAGTEGLNISSICLQSAQHIAAKNPVSNSCSSGIKCPWAIIKWSVKNPGGGVFETVDKCAQDLRAGVQGKSCGLNAMQKKEFERFLRITNQASQVK